MFPAPPKNLSFSRPWWNGGRWTSGSSLQVPSRPLGSPCSLLALSCSELEFIKVNKKVCYPPQVEVPCSSSGSCPTCPQCQQCTTCNYQPSAVFTSSYSPSIQYSPDLANPNSTLFKTTSDSLARNVRSPLLFWISFIDHGLIEFAVSPNGKRPLCHLGDNGHHQFIPVRWDGRSQDNIIPGKVRTG